MTPFFKHFIYGLFCEIKNAFSIWINFHLPNFTHMAWVDTGLVNDTCFKYLMVS